jgi:hypothetical protein
MQQRKDTHAAPAMNDTLRTLFTDASRSGELPKTADEMICGLKAIKAFYLSKSPTEQSANQTIDLTECLFYRSSEFWEMYFRLSDCGSPERAQAEYLLRRLGKDATFGDLHDALAAEGTRETR